MEQKEVVIKDDHLIRHPDGQVEDLKTINGAKRKSRQLQKAGAKVLRLDHRPEWKGIPGYKGKVAPKVQYRKKMKNEVRPKQLRDDDIAQAQAKYAVSQ